MSTFKNFALASLALWLLTSTGLCNAQSQNFPSKPIRLLVGFAAGGGTDVAARLVALKLSDVLGQQVIVENLPGAGGAISVERAARSPTDGYTLVMMAAAATIQSALKNDLRYDLERDLTPISLVSKGPMVLVVNADLPVTTVKELVTMALAQPGKLHFGSAGMGSSPHLAGELLNMLAGIKTVHVPYKGSGESVVGTAAGHVQFNFPSVAAAMPLINAGKLRPIGVSTKKRTYLTPGLATLDESGVVPGYDRAAWFGILAPAGVPKNIILQLNAAINKVVNTDEMKEAFRKEGAEPAAGTPEEFATLIKDEIRTNRELGRVSGIKVQ